MLPSPKRPFANSQGPIVFAHRGWRGHYPENTLIAFDRALKAMPSDAIELDIHATADGELVVIHDDTVDRTTNGSGRVQEFSLAALQKLDAGYWWTADNGRSYPYRDRNIRIPTLAKVFQEYPNCWINIDIKQHQPSIVKPFADLIRDFGMEEKVCVGSFDEATVAAFRAELPDVATAASLSEVRRMVILHKLGLGRFFHSPAMAFQIPEKHGRLSLVTPSFTRRAQRQQTAVHVWTVNEEVDMRRMIAAGVDGIMTDYPDRLLRLLGRLDDSAIRQRASLLFWREGEVLLMKRTRNGRSYYVLPGGGVEDGEDWETAAYREAKEETSFDISLGPIVWEKQVDPLLIERAYLVTDFSGEPRLSGPEAADLSDDNRYDFEWWPLEAAWHLPLYPGNIELANVWDVVEGKL